MRERLHWGSPVDPQNTICCLRCRLLYAPLCIEFVDWGSVAVKLSRYGCTVNTHVPRVACIAECGHSGVLRDSVDNLAYTNEGRRVTGELNGSVELRICLRILSVSGAAGCGGAKAAASRRIVLAI